MYKVTLEKTYQTSPEKIFGLFKNLAVFRLTGADDITCSFIEGGKFSLEFPGRGTISGHITEIEENKKIVLNWNVEGFEREPEVNAEVKFILSRNNDTCTLKLEHNNIMQAVSFEAKKRAWGEILENIESELQ